MQTRLEIYVIKYHECEPHGFHSCGASGKSAVTNISIQHIHVSIDMCHGVCSSHSLLRCLSPTVTLYFSLVLPSRVLRCKNTMPHDIHIPGLTLTRLSTYTKRTPMTPPPTLSQICAESALVDFSFAFARICWLFYQWLTTGILEPNTIKVNKDRIQIVRASYLAVALCDPAAEVYNSVQRITETRPPHI